jgi:hypothetical protein
MAQNYSGLFFVNIISVEGTKYFIKKGKPFIALSVT